MALFFEFINDMCNFPFFQNVSISQKERECYMDLRPYINPCPYTVNEVSRPIILRLLVETRLGMETFVANCTVRMLFV